MLVVIVLAIGLPVGYYLASPLWIRTELVEPAPVAIADPTPAATALPTSRPPDAPAPATATPSPPASSPASPPAEPTPFVSADALQRVVPRHRRLPLRPRDGDDHRDGAGRATPPPRGLLGAQRARTCTSTCRRSPTTTRRGRSSSASSRRPTARSATTCRRVRTRPTSRARSSGASSSPTCSRWPRSTAV